MEGCVAGHEFYLHEGMCVGKCEGQAQGGACMWMLELQLGNSFICVGLCEGKSRAEHVYVDGAGQ